MKLKIAFLLLLCPIFRLSAQDLQLKNYTANIIPGGLAVGEQVPDLLISNITGLRQEGRPLSTLHLVSDTRGKLVILDFWATWCAPCRAMVPVMDSLQRVFGDKVLFLPVAYETEAVTRPVLAAMYKQHPFDLPEVSSDQVLLKLFPHRTLPHYVWIKAGKVIAITDYTAITAENIRLTLKENKLAVREKKDLEIAYDKTQPFLVNGNGGDGASLVYHSVLTGYVPGLPGGLEVSALDPVKGQRYSVRNTSFLWLCRLAYADSGRWFPSARINILAKDTAKVDTRLRGQAFEQWLADGNGWCYELEVPPALAGEKGFELIRADIEKLFPAYDVKLQTRSVKSLVLVRTSAEDKLKTTGGAYKIEVSPFGCHLHNAALSNLIIRLERQYMQRSPLPIANGTGYAYMVDLDLDAPMNDLKALNSALSRYDLAFVEKEYPAQLLVIRDHPNLKP